MPNEFISRKERLQRHDEEIRRDYPDRPTADMAEEMGVNYYTVSRRAARLGVGKCKAFMHTAFKKGAKGGWKVKGEARAKYKANADEYMRAHFATTKNDDLAATLGTDPKTIRRWARRLGLVKSDEFMREARSRGLAKIHQGYYTPEHLAWRLQRIRDVYPDGDAEQIEALCEELGCSKGWLIHLAQEAGIRRTKEAWSRAIKEGQLKSGRTKYTPDILAEIADYYPDHTKQEIAQRFGISPGVIGRLAVLHGWRKSREHIRRIRSEITRAWHERKKE